MEQEIYTALRGLKMPRMAECLRAMDETRQLDKLTAQEALPLLIQAEVTSRDRNRINTLIKQASFRLNTNLEDLEIDASRGLTPESILQVSSCDYIKCGVPIIIGGAAGTGKT